MATNEVVGQGAAAEIDVSVGVVEVFQHLATQEGTQKVVSVVAVLVSPVESLAITT